MKKKGNTTLNMFKKSTSGITLIALVVTIIVLLILSSVTLSVIFGQNGIINRAKNGAVADAISSKKETVQIALASAYTDKMGVADNVSVESVLGEIQRTNNSTEIYAVKGNGVITQAEGTTKFPASILFPESTTGIKTGIRVDIDDKLNITNAVTTKVESVSEALANIEVNKANLVLGLTWENGTPKVTYEETTGADVTIQYMIGTNGTLKTATGGVISESTLKLGDTVYVIVSKEGKQKDGGSVLVIDERDPVITEFKVTETTEDSITVQVTAKDDESGLATTNTYTYYKGGTADGESSTSNTHTYANLTAGTYKLKVEVLDKAENKASTEIDGTIEQTTGNAGIYDSEGTLLASWDTLVTDPKYNLNVEKDYTYSTSNTNNTDGNSMYYVLKQSPFSGKTGLTVVMPGGNPETAVVNNEMDIVNSYEIASINEGVKVATASNQISKIGDYAFRDCSALTSVTIGRGVTSIGSSAFEYCTKLTSVTIPDSVTSIGSSAFRECTKLTSVTIPDRVESIESYAFYACRALTSVTIPDSVTSIGYCAFLDCISLTSVTIGSGLNNLSEFDISSITEINISPNHTKYTSIDGVVFNKNKQEIFMCPRGKQGEYVIPDSVTSIERSAFEHCTKLTSVTIPDSVTNIGSDAFYNCSALTSVTIGRGVTSIGWSVFYECTKLTSVTIPDSVTSIGGSVFYECSALTSVTIGSGLNDLSCFDISSITEINISPNHTKYTSIDGVVFNKDKKEIVFCPKGKQGEYAIPDSVTSIGSYAFYNCNNLSLYIPDSVETIENWDATNDCYSVSYGRSDWKSYYFGISGESGESGESGW